MSNIANSKNKKIHIELLRIICLFCVMFNHSQDRGFFLFSERTDSPFYFFYMFTSVLCKIAVPTFFMISGALLLGKDESFKTIFTKRILRILIVLVVISVPYYFWLCKDINEASISNFFETIYISNTTTALWYLYSYIGFLLMLPLIRKLVKNMEKKDYIYVFVCHIILVGILPCLEYLIWKGNATINPSFSAVLFTTNNIFYTIEGYYIENFISNEKYNRKNKLLALIFSFIAVAVTCSMTYYRILVTGVCNQGESQQFYNNFICIPSFAVYFLIKGAMNRKLSQKLKDTIICLGGAVFGVYLIEKFMRAITNKIYIILCPYIGSFLSCLIWILCGMALGFIIIIGLKRIPYINKVINKFI